MAVFIRSFFFFFFFFVGDTDLSKHVQASIYRDYTWNAFSLFLILKQKVGKNYVLPGICNNVCASRYLTTCRHTCHAHYVFDLVIVFTHRWFHKDFVTNEPVARTTSHMFTLFLDFRYFLAIDIAVSNINDNIVFMMFMIEITV